MEELEGLTVHLAEKEKLSPYPGNPGDFGFRL